MSAPKLVYFDARGRAELIRLTMAAGGIAFEDIRNSREQWLEMKPKAPFGQAPMAEIGGRYYAQSVALANYFAREGGLYGSSNLQALEIDQIVQLVQDFYSLAIKAFYNQNEEEKKKAFEKLQSEDAPKYLKLFTKALDDNKTGYFVGSSLTLADLAVYDLLYNMNKKSVLSLDEYTSLKKLSDKIENDGKIKTYLANRKDTDN